MAHFLYVYVEVGFIITSTYTICLLFMKKYVIIEGLRAHIKIYENSHFDKLVINLSAKIAYILLLLIEICLLFSEVSSLYRLQTKFDLPVGNENKLKLYSKWVYSYFIQI